MCFRFASVLNTDTDGTGPAALQKAVVQSFLHNYDDAIFVLDRAAGLDPSPSQYILLGEFINNIWINYNNFSLNLLGDFEELEKIREVFDFERCWNIEGFLYDMS